MKEKVDKMKEECPMKVKITIVVLIAIVGISLFFIFGDKEESRFRKDGPSGIDGNVIEVIDKESILVEVTSDGDGFDNGDKVIVKYHRGLWMNYEDMGEIIPAKILSGDKVSVQFWGDDVSQGEEYEIISVDSIHKYTDKDENYKDLSTEHSNYISGKVTKVNDDNSVVVEITKERGGYTIGEQVLVKYRHVLNLSYVSEKDDVAKKELKVDDLVEVEVWHDEIEQKEDMDVITVENVYINNWYDVPTIDED